MLNVNHIVNSIKLLFTLQRVMKNDEIDSIDVSIVDGASGAAKINFRLISHRAHATAARILKSSTECGNFI